MRASRPLFRQHATRVVGTTAFRLALATAGAFAIAVALLSGLFYLFAYERVLAQIDGDISGDRQCLHEILDEKGMPGLVAALGRRFNGPRRKEAHYQLTGADGQWLAGNLPVVAPAVGWSWVATPVDPSAGLDDGVLRAWTERLPNGGSLLVARNPWRLDDLEDLMISGVLWCELGTMLFGLLSGYVVSRRVLRGVATMADAAGRIGAGDLAHRIPPVGGGAEIAAIGGAVNLMLDRIGVLTDRLRQVTDDIAHDLRTPLGRLRQNLERAASTAGTVEEFQAAVDRALDEADAIIATFNALLRIAQVEARDRTLGFGIVDLSGLATRLADIYKPSAEDEGHSFHAAIEPDVTLTGDADLLGQMVANLIENALRHTPSDSTIAIALTRRPDGSPRLIVQDNGPGVPPEQAEAILRRFVRLDSSRATPGTGLGLALVKAVADLHGIAIGLEDMRPGLRVVLDFPAAARVLPGEPGDRGSASPAAAPRQAVAPAHAASIAS